MKTTEKKLKEIINTTHDKGKPLYHCLFGNTANFYFDRVKLNEKNKMNFFEKITFEGLQELSIHNEAFYKFNHRNFDDKDWKTYQLNKYAIQNEFRRRKLKNLD